MKSDKIKLKRPRPSVCNCLRSVKKSAQTVPVINNLLPSHRAHSKFDLLAHTWPNLNDEGVRKIQKHIPCSVAARAYVLCASVCVCVRYSHIHDTVCDSSHNACCCLLHSSVWQQRKTSVVTVAMRTNLVPSNRPVLDSFFCKLEY